MSFNKRASLEISIQAIIIIVLAMTLLGLGLGFIRGMFKNITGTTQDVTEQVREQILNDLRTSDKKISFPKTEIIIGKGESTILNVGIRNKGNENLYYSIDFISISAPTSTGTVSPVAPTAYDSWFQIATPSTGSWKLSQSESDIRSIRVDIPKSVLSGSYAFTFEVLDTSTTPKTVYDSKDFFIVVTG